MKKQKRIFWLLSIVLITIGAVISPIKSDCYQTIYYDEIAHLFIHEVKYYNFSIPSKWCNVGIHGAVLNDTTLLSIVFLNQMQYQTQYQTNNLTDSLAAITVSYIDGNIVPSIFTIVPLEIYYVALCMSPLIIIGIPDIPVVNDLWVEFSLWSEYYDNVSFTSSTNSNTTSFTSITNNLSFTTSITLITTATTTSGFTITVFLILLSILILKKYKQIEKGKKI